MWTRSATSTSTRSSAPTIRWSTTKISPTSSSPPLWVRTQPLLPRSFQRASELHSGAAPERGDHAVVPSGHGVKWSRPRGLQEREASDLLSFLSPDVRLRLFPPEADPHPFPGPSSRIPHFLVIIRSWFHPPICSRKIGTSGRNASGRKISSTCATEKLASRRNAWTWSFARN